MAPVPGNQDKKENVVVDDDNVNAADRNLPLQVSPFYRDLKRLLRTNKDHRKLPFITQHALPSPTQQEGLPSPPVRHNELPPPKQQDELPPSIKQDELPLPIQQDELPIQTSQNDINDGDDFVELFSLLCSQSESDLLSDVALKLYVDLRNSSFGAKEQEGLTCYANAVAAVLHLAMKRIVGRDGGYPDFCTLREEIVQQHGQNGACTFEVLEEVCPRYRLHYREVDTQGALSAVAEKRPVIVLFNLTDKEWEVFGNFYEETPTGILTEAEINIKSCQPDEEREGHAVVLSSFTSEYLRLMNSWGSDWGDEGFFKVKNTDVLGFLCVDIYWTLDDLSANEKAQYEKRKKKLNSILAHGRQSFQPEANLPRPTPPSPRKR